MGDSSRIAWLQSELRHIERFAKVQMHNVSASDERYFREIARIARDAVEGRLHAQRTPVAGSTAPSSVACDSGPADVGKTPGWAAPPSLIKRVELLERKTAHLLVLLMGDAE